MIFSLFFFLKKKKEKALDPQAGDENSG